jgi:hypothetical protein
MKVTRRAIAQMLAATAAIPSPAAPQAESGDPARLAREQFEKNAQRMAEVRIPMSTEPPFHFKA